MAVVEIEAAEAAGSNKNAKTSEKRGEVQKTSPLFYFELSCPFLGMFKTEPSPNFTIIVPMTKGLETE